MIDIHNRGTQIRSLAQLQDAADDRKSVICLSRFRGFAKPKPASVVINLQGRMLLEMIDSGMYVYISDGKKRSDRAFAEIQKFLERANRAYGPEVENTKYVMANIAMDFMDKWKRFEKGDEQ